MTHALLECVSLHIENGVVRKHSYFMKGVQTCRPCLHCQLTHMLRVLSIMHACNTLQGAQRSRAPGLISQLVRHTVHPAEGVRAMQRGAALAGISAKLRK